MSLRDKTPRRHRKGASRSRSLLHKYDGHKMSAVVNHIHFERFHGFESTKHKDKHSGGLPVAQAS